MSDFSGWGNYPTINGTVKALGQKIEARELIDDDRSCIAQGNSRSYGDSALAETMISTLPRNLFKSFDSDSGILEVDAGVLSEDIISTFVPRGWFLSVTPGTKLITVGGAIASDVHGKNHHIKGSFSECVLSFELDQGKQEIVSCSRENNPELFYTSCGGQGLTGVIVSAKIQLLQIGSQSVQQSNYKTKNLKQTIEAFEQHADTPYSVAWIDCTATGASLGRGHVTVGEFCDDGDFDYKAKKRINLPLFLPKFSLNPITLKLFNLLYFHRQRIDVKHSKVGIDSFFYPLDFIRNWNRAYGKPGFVQYQFVLPLEHSREGLETILSMIAESKKGSFLAVLKLFGEQNENYLSFPMKGYTLALDFKVEPSLFPFLERLDQQVQRYGGRLYLAKDSRVSKEVFEAGYRQIDRFKQYRKEHGLDQIFNSAQSKRLGL